MNLMVTGSKQTQTKCVCTCVCAQTCVSHDHVPLLEQEEFNQDSFFPQANNILKGGKKKKKGKVFEGVCKGT